MPTLRQAAKDDITLIHELACQAFPATYRDLLSREHAFKANFANRKLTTGWVMRP